MDAAAAPTAEPSYRHRLSAFRKWRTYGLTDDALTWSEDGGREGRLPFDQIKEVRIAFRGDRMRTNLYRTRVTIKSGASLDLTNSSFVSLGSFRDQSAEYNNFIRALHQRLAASGAEIDFRKGSSALGYIGNLLASLFVIVAVIFVLVLATTGVMAIADPRMISIVFALPLLYVFMKRTRPERYDPINPPADGLPRVAEKA